MGLGYAGRGGGGEGAETAFITCFCSCSCRGSQLLPIPHVVQLFEIVSAVTEAQEVHTGQPMAGTAPAPFPHAPPGGSTQKSDRTALTAGLRLHQLMPPVYAQNPLETQGWAGTARRRGPGPQVSAWRQRQL
jgi:hypothetical protein